MIARDGPMMLQRTISILMECKQVWPLASRWVEALDKFSRDPDTTPLATEGSMADGKDPVPNPVNPPSSLTTTILQPPTASSSAPIPPPPNPLIPPTTIPPSQNLYTRPRGSFDLHSPVDIIPPQPNLLPASYPTIPGEPFPTPLPQVPPQMYLSDNTPLRHPSSGVADGVGMLISAFDSSAAQGYDLSNGAPIAFYPTTDGFEGELQYYIEGPQDWMPTGVFDGYG